MSELNTMQYVVKMSKQINEKCCQKGKKRKPIEIMMGKEKDKKKDVNENNIND